jgi:hypothetical protein
MFGTILNAVSSFQDWLPAEDSVWSRKKLEVPEGF